MPSLRRILLGLLPFIPVVAMAQRDDSVIAIVRGTLIDGNGGQPIPNATILVRGGRIVAAGSATTIATPRARESSMRLGSSSLGFVDANVHVSIYSGLENCAVPVSLHRCGDRGGAAAPQGWRHYRPRFLRHDRPACRGAQAFRTGRVRGPAAVRRHIVGWGGPWSFSFTGRPPENLSLLQEQMNDAITRGGGEELVNMEPDSLRAA
jgi:hypothetical protein